MLQTPNLSLPYIDLNEAQREVVHNNAIRSLDALVQLAVLDRDLASPPGSPSDGQRWIVAASPTGAWAGHAGHVAAWQDGAWRFYVPTTGWLAYVVDEGTLLGWSGGVWVDAMAILTTLQNMVLLGIGTTADSTNPLSAKLNNTLWTAKTVAEGGDGNLRYKMSKESAAKTLSLLMQTNFSGRAEIGLAGDDDLHFKVSPDGSTWTEALAIDRTSGATRINAALSLPAGNVSIGVLDAANPAATKQLEFLAGGYGTPATLNTASTGDKIIFYRNASYDAAVGIGSSSNLWFKSSGSGSAGRFDFYTGSTPTFEMAIAGGMVLGAATGAFKGVGTFNAVAVYDDNVLLTCHALADDFIKSGKVDTAALDALVPPTVIPERIEQVPLLEDVAVEKTELQRQPDGAFLAVSKTVIEKRQVRDWTPVYDANGNGIDAVQEPVFDKEIVHPEQIVPRRNEVGHLFKAMVDEGFDPRDPAQYFARLKADQALPGMPTRANWQHGQLSTGEIHCRLWLATEMLALVVVALHERIQRLEAH